MLQANSQVLAIQEMGRNPNTLFSTKAEVPNATGRGDHLPWPMFFWKEQMAGKDNDNRQNAQTILQRVMGFF